MMEKESASLSGPLALLRVRPLEGKTACPFAA
jgi:hypothetical protein